MFKFSLMLMLATAAILLPASDTGKMAAMEQLRAKLAGQKIRPDWFPKGGSWQDAAHLLAPDGSFSDLKSQEEKIRAGNLTQKEFDHQKPQADIAKLTSTAFERLLLLNEALRTGAVPAKERDAMRGALYRAVANYGDLEVNRLSTHAGRWLNSCFFIPVAAVNLYFTHFADMERVERGEAVSPELRRAHEFLLKLAFQAWSQPMRRDATDADIVSPERFRNSTFYVGGNAFYRPLLEAALVMKSIPMIEVAAEVAANSIAATSQTTARESFWSEGITADGAGWGHGRQALVWGYPVDGISGALAILRQLAGTPWTAELPRESIEAYLNFLRGSSFYYYRGHVAPLVSRDNMRRRDLAPHVIRTRYLTSVLLELFPHSFTASERAELDQFLREANRKAIRMAGEAPGRYTGIRYFFNNDDMIAKNDDYYMIWNMASYRCDGLESGQSGYNMFANDGATIFSRDGKEHREAFGSWEPNFFPGVTARQLDALQPSDDWSGYCSKADFAAGVTDGKENFASGFLFDKYNATWKYSDWKRKARFGSNPKLYGVVAHKSCFKFGDLFLLLGCGISDTEPGNGGNLITTIEQVVKKPDFAQLREDASAFRNNGFAYAVLPQESVGTVQCDSSNHPLAWERVHRENKAEQGSQPMFRMWIDHGRNPKDAKYAYCVSATGAIPETLPRIVMNTPAAQAAMSPDGTTLGAVIYDASARLDTPWGEVSASAPCALLITENSNHWIIRAADGTMKQETLTVKIGSIPTTLTLPQGAHKGASAQAIQPKIKPSPDHH